MRPLRLKVRGLRSYLGEHEFDFEGRGLLAIIGDTGAGKSSILEGLCFALYGTCTWSGSESRVLVADGAQSMTVELTFRAEGQTWKVARTVPSGAYPPARHVLTCLDDGKSLDNSGPVNERIVSLLGMDYKAFLRAVILPQGRFQELLQSTATERTRLLKGIFRVDEIEGVRANASTFLGGLRQNLAALELERAGFLKEPRAVADEARARRESARSVEGRILASTEIVAASKARALAALQTKATAQSAATDLQARLVPAADLELAALAGLAERLKNEQAILAKEQQSAANRLAVHQTSLETALGGVPEAIVLGAGQTLRLAARELQQIDTDEASLATRRSALAERENAYTRDVAAYRELRAKEADAIQAVEDLRARDETAARHLDAAKSLLQSARKAAALAVLTADSLAQSEPRVAELQVAHAAATSTHAQARDAVAAADAGLEEMRRLDAAARAAHGRHPGDDCPVCNRTLPAGWQPPIAEGEAQAIAALSAARKQADAAQQAMAAAGEQLAAGRSTLARAVRDHTQADDEAGRSLAVLLQAIPGADLGIKDDAILAQSVAAGVAVRAELAAANAAREDLLREVAAENGRLKIEQAVVLKERETLQSGDEAIRDRRASLDRDIRGLPANLRPLALNAESLDAAATRAIALATTIAAMQVEVAAASAEERKKSDALQTLVRQLRSEVDEQLSSLRMKLVALETQAQAAARALGQPEPVFEHGIDAAETASWASHLGVAVDDLLRAAGQTIATADADAAQASDALAGSLEEAAVGSEVELARALTDAVAAGQNAERDMLGAEAQIEPAEALDRRIGESTRLRNAVEDLVSLLQDSKFITFITDRRQVALLAVASELFGDMSAKRYGFAADFRIVDRHSGQVRDVRTLSGGETFLASLALALALVELAGRSKGRLEALFLDEGFASLDSNALAQAIDALREQATNGRLVAVISHLHAVAESFEDVMLVTRDSAGSHARWLSPADRDALLEDEARSRLLV